MRIILEIRNQRQNNSKLWSRYLLFGDFIQYSGFCSAVTLFKGSKYSFSHINKDFNSEDSSNLFK